MRIAGKISIVPFRRNAMERIKDFIKKHKTQIINLVLYILAFICGAVIF